MKLFAFLWGLYYNKIVDKTITISFAKVRES